MVAGKALRCINKSGNSQGKARFSFLRRTRLRLHGRTDIQTRRQIACIGFLILLLRQL
jgi:hypothetical protein